MVRGCSVPYFGYQRQNQKARAILGFSMILGIHGERETQRWHDRDDFTHVDSALKVATFASGKVAQKFFFVEPFFGYAYICRLRFWF